MYPVMCENLELVVDRTDYSGDFKRNKPLRQQLARANNFDSYMRTVQPDILAYIEEQVNPILICILLLAL